MSHSFTSIRRLYAETLNEPIPDEFMRLLNRLPGFSDGSGGLVGRDGPTSPGSDPSSGASLAIHPGVQSHNLNAPLSTPWNRGGSNA